MRIAHVVPLISDDGAFGGPVAVLRSQVEALAVRGHVVEVFAGWDGKAHMRLPGVEVHLFPAHQTVPGTGFSGLTAAGLPRLLARGRFDVVHVHFGRHLIGIHAALAALRGGARVVVQTHGMVAPSKTLKARALDTIAVRRILRRAAAVLVLTEAERQSVETVAGQRVRVVRVPNGIARRPTVVARKAPRGREVLFLARLHPRKRVLAYASAAKILRERGRPARFSVVGPDEGDLVRLRRVIDDEGLEDVTYEGALPIGAGSARLSEADVYVLPAEREVFPMTVLEALAVGTPVVLARDCGIADELERAGAAQIVDGDPISIADAVESLLSDTSTWRRQSEAGLALVDNRLSIDAVAIALVQIYRDGTDQVRTSPAGAPE